MRVLVQSKYLLDEELLVNIWRRSAPVDECFNDWRRKPETNLGAFSFDSIFFWGNWVRTNRGLTPVFFGSETMSRPEEWRIIVNFDNSDEAEKSVVIEENESSVYVYRLSAGELTRFRLVREDRPQLLESQIDETPDWLAEKIAAKREEKLSNVRAAESRLSSLAARLEQIKQRRR